MSEITNPYRPGEPVADPAMLFGRQDAADWLELQLNSNAHALVLSGQPQIGKTSLIRHLGELQTLHTYNLLVTLPDPAAFHQPASGRRAEPRNERTIIDTILHQLVEQVSPQLAQLNLISPAPIDDSTPIASALQKHLTISDGQSRLMVTKGWQQPCLLPGRVNRFTLYPLIWA